MSSMSMFSEAEFNEFKQEWLEMLDQCESGILAVSAGEPLAQHYDAIFRTFHSVKGSAAMFDMVELQTHVHELETFFTQFKGQSTLEPHEADRLLKGCDVARGMIDPGFKADAHEETVSAPDSAPAAAVAPASESAGFAPSAAVSRETLNEYLAESHEMLHGASGVLGRVKSAGGAQPDAADVAEFYRQIHTVKGSSALFGFKSIADLAHALESRLESVRDGSKPMTPDLLEQLYKGIDLMDAMLEAIEKGVEFSRAAEAGPLMAALAAEPATASALASVGKSTVASSAVRAPAAAAAVSAAPPPKAAPPPAANPVHPGENSGGGDANQTLRVSVGLLDRLMSIVGEMVLVRNQVIQYSNKHDDLEFINLSQRLDVVTSEMQTEVMKTRMQRIGTVLDKFQRVVRDLSRDLAKKIDFSVSGAETELDKALLEAVKDPLMHIVRNACDHGLEAPADRLAAGKNEEGKILIRAFHEGGQVFIEIVDDGRGLNREKILKKAIERNLVSADRARELSEKDVFNFIFAAGFSTASSVTSVSGRGVGMDVVKKNIEKIGGVVEIDSTEGRGTTIRLRIPLTLAIVPAMIVRSGLSRFAIPQVKLVELVRVERDKAGNQIEILQGAQVYRLRGQLLPIFDLSRVLKLSGAAGDVSNDTGADVVNIVVVSGEAQTFGLIVDEVLDTADIVVKPLNQLLKSLSVYSGATVLGDGSVSLILDIVGIAQRQGLRAESGARDLNESAVRRVGSGSGLETSEYLLVRLNATAKHAIPLSVIQRMEEFSSTQLERSGDSDVVRYRGSILPIVSMNAVLGYGAEAASEKVSVIVIRVGTGSVGIRVNEILDVFASEQTIDDSLRDRNGVLGNLIHQEEVVVVIDVSRSLAELPFMRSLRATQEQRVVGAKRVLYVEDAGFFRRHVSDILTKAGFEVVTAEHGAQGLSILKSAGPGAFDVIVSDIEMPVMNGIEFARSVRADRRFDATPLVALTTRFNDADIKRGREAGFDHYLEKLDPEALVEQVVRSLNAPAQKGLVA